MSGSSIRFYCSVCLPVPMPCCFYYYSFLIQSEARNGNIPSSSFIIQYFFLAVLNLMIFHMKLKIVLSSFLKNFFLEFWWGLHCICKLLWERMAIFTALILLIMSTGELSIFWYVCSSVSFFSVLKFLLYKFFTCLVRILP